MQANFNPNARAKLSMDNDWHTKKAQPTSKPVFSANQYTGSFYPAECAAATNEHAAEIDFDNISQYEHYPDIVEDGKKDDVTRQLGRAASPVQHVTDDAADHDAEDTFSPAVGALGSDGYTVNAPTVMPIDGYRYDAHAQEALPPIGTANLSQRSPLSAAKRLHRASHSTIKLAKVRSPLRNMRRKSILLS
jgi:hypothetical protein